MSYPINSTINPYSQPAMGLNALSAEQLQLQNVDAAKIHQGVTQNSALKGVASGNEKNAWLTPVLSIPVWIAMALGMDKFNSKCRGKYEDSIVGQVQAKSEQLGNSKILKSKPVLTAANKINAGYKVFMEKVVPKSKILSALIHTPSQPTNKIVKTMMGGTYYEVATDAIQKLNEYTKEGTINLDLLKKAGISIDEYKNMSKNIQDPKNVEKLIKLCETNGDQMVKMKNIIKIPFSNKLTSNKQPKYLSDFIPGVRKVLAREVQLSEYSNKLKALSITKGNFLGKKVPKLMLRLIEGLTNGTAGGKFAIFMGAFFVADAIKKTIDAPKGHGEKRKTFAEHFIYNEAMYLTMPFGLKIMHGCGGLQYIGVKKENLDKFRTEKLAFDEKVLAGQYKDRAAYNAEVKRIKNIKNPDINWLKGDKAGTKAVKSIKNILYKPLTWGARVLTSHLETFEPFNPKGITKKSKLLDRIGQFLKHSKLRSLKWVAGGPTRFIFYLFLIAPFLGKIAAKGSHIIFGKPAKSVLDEGKEEPKEQPLPQARPVVTAAQQAGQMQQVPANAAHNQTAPIQRQNLLNMYNTNATSQKSMVSAPEAGRTYTYMPSAEAVKVQPGGDPEDNKVQALLAKSENAEKAANRFIKG